MHPMLLVLTYCTEHSHFGLGVSEDNGQTFKPVTVNLCGCEQRKLDTSWAIDASIAEALLTMALRTPTKETG